jgi:hypothetical protein
MKYLVIVAILTGVPALGWCFRPEAQEPLAASHPSSDREDIPIARPAFEFSPVAPVCHPAPIVLAQAAPPAVVPPSQPIAPRKRDPIMVGPDGVIYQRWSAGR